MKFDICPAYPDTLNSCLIMDAVIRTGGETGSLAAKTALLNCIICHEVRGEYCTVNDLENCTGVPTDEIHDVIPDMEDRGLTSTFLVPEVYQREDKDMKPQKRDIVRKIMGQMPRNAIIYPSENVRQGTIPSG